MKNKEENKLDVQGLEFTGTEFLGKITYEPIESSPLLSFSEKLKDHDINIELGILNTILDKLGSGHESLDDIETCFNKTVNYINARIKELNNAKKRA